MLEVLKIPLNILRVPKLGPTQKTLLLVTVELHVPLITLLSSCNFISSQEKKIFFTLGLFYKDDKHDCIDSKSNFGIYAVGFVLKFYKIMTLNTS